MQISEEIRLILINWHQKIMILSEKGSRLQKSVYSIYKFHLCGRKTYVFNMCIKNTERALAGVAYWIERQPVNQRVIGLIPSQGTCVGCRPGLQWGACEKQPHIDVSLPFSPSIAPSPKIKKKNFIKKKKGKSALELGP